VEEEDHLTPAEGQMCRTVISTASHTFKQNLNAYMKVQEDFRAAVKEKVARQLRIAYPEAADEEIMELAHEDPTAVREAHVNRFRGAEDRLRHCRLRCRTCMISTKVSNI